MPIIVQKKRIRVYHVLPKHGILLNERLQRDVDNKIVRINFNDKCVGELTSSAMTTADDLNENKIIISIDAAQNNQIIELSRCGYLIIMLVEQLDSTSQRRTGTS